MTDTFRQIRAHQRRVDMKNAHDAALLSTRKRSPPLSSTSPKSVKRPRIGFPEIEQLASPEHWIERKSREYDNVTVVVESEPIAFGGTKKVWRVPSDIEVIQKSESKCLSSTVEEEAHNMWKLNALISHIPHFVPQFALQSNGSGPNWLLRESNNSIHKPTSIQWNLHEFVTFRKVWDWPPNVRAAAFSSMRLQLAILNHVLEGRMTHIDDNTDNYMFRRLTISDRDYCYRIRWMDNGVARFEFTVPCWMMIVDMDKRSVRFIQDGITNRDLPPRKKRVRAPFTEMDKYIRVAMERDHMDMTGDEWDVPPEPYSDYIDDFLNDVYRVSKKFELHAPVLGTWTMFMDWSQKTIFTSSF